MSDQRRPRELLRTRHACVSISTFEEDYALTVVRDTVLGLGRALLVWSAGRGLVDGLIAGVPPVPNTENPVEALRAFAARDAGVLAALDLAPHLQSAVLHRALRDAIQSCGGPDKRLILIDHSDSFPDVIRSYVTPLELSLPDDEELERIVRATLRTANRQHPIAIDIPRGGFDAILQNLRGLTRRQAERVILDVVGDDRRFDEADVQRVIAGKRRLLQQEGALRFIESPASLDEIGGLRALKAWLASRQNSLSREAAEFGLEPPRGVLLLGVQGAGKSLCAKAISTAWRRPLMRMDVGALYDKYVGESEARLRLVLRQTEQMAPVVLWIDEIEKGFASAASQSTDGGLSKRMFGALLTWMQDHDAPVFLVATANDIEALPPELLRKGRFDEIFFVDLPPPEVRAEIFAIHLRKRSRDPSAFDLPALAQAADGFSGAEIEQAIVAAMHAAFAARRTLDTEAIRAAVQASPPLSQTMRERVAALRAWARGRCVPAD